MAIGVRLVGAFMMALGLFGGYSNGHRRNTDGKQPKKGATMGLLSRQAWFSILLLVAVATPLPCMAVVVEDHYTVYVGSKSKVSEVLSGHRPLSLPMIRALHEGLGIPLEILAQDPNPRRNPRQPPIAMRVPGS